MKGNSVSFSMVRIIVSRISILSWSTDSVSFQESMTGSSSEDSNGRGRVNVQEALVTIQCLFEFFKIRIYFEIPMIPLSQVKRID